jgi:hypothetical protein
LMQFVPKDVRPMVEAGMKVQAQKRNQLASQLAQQQIALQNKRDATLAELNNQFSALPDEAKQFPAIQHEFKRQQILADMDLDRGMTSLAAYGQPSEALHNQLKMVEDKYKRYEEDLKPWETTEANKAIKQNWQKLAESNKRVNTLISTISKTKELLDSGNRQAAMENIRTNVLKPLNSIDSDDALQIGEVLLKFNKVMNAPETAEFAGKKITNPTVWFNKYLQAKTKQEKEGIQKGFFETISTLFDSDPEGFLETAIDGANSHVDSYNKRVREQVINTTSPGVARRMGAVPLEYVAQIRKPREQETANPLYTQYPFGTTISTGAGTMTPSAPQMSGQAPMQAPINQPEQSPLNQRVGGPTLFRIEPRR